MASPNNLPPEEEILLPEATTPAESIVARGTGFWLRYRYYVAGAFVAILLGFAGYYLYRLSLKDKQQEAMEQMVTAVNFFEQDSVDKAINGSGQFPGFATLVEDYEGTPAGNLCHYYLGMCYLKKQKFEDGIEQLQQFDKADDMLSAMAYAALGYAYEELNDPDKAAESYLKAASTEPNKETTPYFWFSAARVQEAAGDKGQARELYLRIKNEYPQSPEGLTIERDLARVSD